MISSTYPCHEGLINELAFIHPAAMVGFNYDSIYANEVKVETAIIILWG